MIIRFSPFYLAALAVFSLAAPSLAHAEDGEAGRQSCTLENSAPLSISRAFDETADYIDECVAVSGTLAGDAIYESIGDVYLPSTRPSDLISRGIGLAARSHGNFDGHSGSLMLVGRLVDCAAVQHSIARQNEDYAKRMKEEGSIIIMERPTGFCWNNSGLAVEADVIETIEAAGFLRLTSDRDRRRFGDMKLFDSDSPYAVQIEAIAEYARGQKCLTNQPAMSGSALDNPAINGPDAPLQWTVNKAINDDGRTQILAGLCAKKQQQTALFTLSASSEYYGQKRGPTHFHAVQCYCLEEDCTDKWPIALIDSVWDAQLPYFCESFFDYARNRWSDLEGDGPMNYSGWSVDFPRNNALDNPLRITMFSERD